MAVNELCTHGNSNRLEKPLEVHGDASLKIKVCGQLQYFRPVQL